MSQILQSVFPENVDLANTLSKECSIWKTSCLQNSFRYSEKFFGKIFPSEAACPPDGDSQALLAVLNRLLCSSFSTEVAETARALHR